MISAEDAGTIVEQLIHEAEAFSGEDIVRAIYEEVRHALEAGEDRAQLVATVTTLYDYLGTMGKEEDQHAVADVIDALKGFCSPSTAL